jgi:hypothetical protein
MSFSDEGFSHKQAAIRDLVSVGVNAPFSYRGDHVAITRFRRFSQSTSLMATLRYEVRKQLGFDTSSTLVIAPGRRARAIDATLPSPKLLSCNVLKPSRSLNSLDNQRQRYGSCCAVHLTGYSKRKSPRRSSG